MLTSSTIAEPYAPSAYAGGTTYALGAIVTVAADFANYESLQASNLGNTPLSSPLWWRKIGVTETAYDVAHTYALGDTVSSSSSHRCYESLQAANLGKPLPVLPETTTDWWIDVGPTMKYAMFDLSRNTQSVGPSPLTAVVALGQRMNTIGLTGMAGGDTLTLKVTSVARGGTIYPLAYDSTKTYAKNDCMTVGLATCYKSLVDGNVGHAAPDAAYWSVVSGAVFDLNTRVVYDANTYYFSPITTRPVKAVFDVPQVSDPVVTITLTATAGNCKIGGATMGANVYLGQLLRPSKNKGKSFSSVTRDKYGTATLVPRPFIPTLDGQLLTPSYLVDLSLDTRAAFDAQSILYSGMEEDGDWTNAFTIQGVHQLWELGTSDSDDFALIQFSAEEI